MRFMKSELGRNKSDIAHMMDEKISLALEAAPQMRRTPADLERKKRQAYCNWADKYEAQRQDELRDIGFSEREIAQIMEEDFLDSIQTSYGEPRPTTIVSQPQPKRWEWKVSDLGTFDGDPESFLTWSRHIRQLWDRKIDPHYREPLLDTLPLCFRGAAKDWFNSLSGEEVLALKSWEHYEEKLRRYFAPDDILIKELADSRKWEFKKEGVSDYYFDKKKLLAGAYPNHQERDLCHNIWMGLPSSFRLHCRTPMANNPTCLDLLLEMRKMEETWKGEQGVRRNPASQGLKSTTAKQESKDTSQSSNLLKPVKSERSAKRRPLKETYTSKNIFYKNKVRHYRIPDTDEVLELQRPCSKPGCHGDHFDFEHDFLVGDSNKKIKQEIHYVEGYVAHSIYDFNNSDVSDDSMDTDDTTPTHSPASSRNSSRQPSYSGHDVINLIDDLEDKSGK